MNADLLTTLRAKLQSCREAGETDLAEPETSYVVGVSGGVDSVVLLDLLTRAEFRRLVVAHVNHRLRGEEADADEGFVRTLAERCGCVCETTSVNVARRAQHWGASVETAGRQVRRAFFAEVAARHRATRVFLAHHADDQAETVLMHLLRGSGPRGLAGMREIAEAGPITLVRPLLGVRRSEILAYAQERGLAWREDASNAGREALRNRLRHDTLPQLAEAFGRDVVPALVRYARVAAEEDAYLEKMALQFVARGGGFDESFPLDAFLPLDLPLQRRVLLCWLRHSGIPDLGLEEVDAALAMAHSSGKPASLNLPGGHRLRRNRGRLFIDRQ